MITTVFFDLDGTLINLEIDAFLAGYIKALTPRFAGLVPPDRFAGQLMRWSHAMIENLDPGLTNLDVFWSGFPTAVGVERSVLEPIFTRFYAEDFSKLYPPNVRNPVARRLMRVLTGAGYTPVIATNPVFPRAAIIERLDWAECGDFPYAYITCGEEMHFCKPNLEFFHEILKRVNRAARECLMVGNDMEEDMVAQKLGFATALVTDCLIDRGKSGITPDWRGTLAELADLFTARDKFDRVFAR